MKIGRRRRRKPFPRRRKRTPHRINGEIRAKEVRVVSDDEGNKGVMPASEALELAEEAALDLVEIAPKANPPVCKIIDYNKFLFEQKKKKKAIKAKSSKVVVKEIRFGPNTEEHDFNFKKNHAKNFLQEGAKLKAYVFFKGRSILFKDKGELLLLRLAQELDDYGSVEQMPKMEGKRMIMLISPKKKKN